MEEMQGQYLSPFSASNIVKQQEVNIRPPVWATASKMLPAPSFLPSAFPRQETTSANQNLKFQAMTANSEILNQAEGYKSEEFFMAKYIYCLAPSKDGGMLSGSNTRVMATLFYDNVNSYIQELLRQKPPDYAALATFTEIRNSLEVEFNYQDKLSQIKKSPEKGEAMKAQLAEKMSQDVANLKPNNMWFHNGGVFRLHAIGFDIKKEENGTYTFKVINSGGGGHFYHNIADSGVTKDEVPLAQANTVVYKNLTLNDLNEDFFKGLIAFETDKVALAPLQIPRLYGYLERLNKGDNKEDGRAYQMQRGENCVYKTLEIWIHSQLVPLPADAPPSQKLAYYDYKRHMVQSAEADYRSAIEKTRSGEAQIKKTVETTKNVRKVTWLSSKLEALANRLSNSNTKSRFLILFSIAIKYFFCSTMVKLQQEESREYLLEQLNGKVQRLDAKIEEQRKQLALERNTEGSTRAA